MARPGQSRGSSGEEFSLLDFGRVTPFVKEFTSKRREMVRKLILL